MTDKPETANPPQELTFIDHGVQAVFASRLAHYSVEPDGMMRLTFCEERVDLENPGKRVLAVSARVVIPRSQLDEMLRFLTLVRDGVTATGPMHRTIN